MTTKSLVGRQMKFKLTVPKKEQEWDNRFILGKIPELKFDSKARKSSAIMRKVQQSKQTLQMTKLNTLNSEVGELQGKTTSNLRAEELLQQIMQNWEENKVPEFHRRYFIESLHTTWNQEDIIEVLEKELYGQQEGTANVLKLMKVTRGREKCLLALKQAVQEIKNTNNLMISVRRISELITHIRILTINVVEIFSEWKNTLQQNQYRFFEWIWRDWNYIIKISIDTKFLNEFQVLHQFLHFSLYDDPFYLSIIQQAYQTDTEFNDYLQQHKIPRSIMRRIRFCEAVLLEEHFKYKIQVKQMRDIEQHTLNQQNFFPREQYNSPISHRVLPNNKEQEIQEFSTRTKELTQISALENYALAQLTIDFELPDILKTFREKSNTSYRASFPETIDNDFLQNNDGKCFYVFKEQKYHVGMMLCAIDKQYLQGNRWVILQIYGIEIEVFKRSIQLLMKFLETCDHIEIFIQLINYEQEEINKKEMILMDFPIFRDVLLKFGFEKQQTFNRKTTYILKRKIQTKEQTPFPSEPKEYSQSKLQVQEQKVVKHENLVPSQPTWESITTEEIILGYYCVNTNKLIQYDQDKEKLSETLKQSYFSAIKFKKVEGKEKIQEFLMSGQYNFTPPQFYENVDIQLTNLCLRWQSFDVEMINGCKTLCLKTEESIFDEDEQSIVQLNSSNPQYSKSLYLVNTLEEDIVFFILELEGTLPNNQNELEKILEKSFEVYDQKTRYEGQAIWVPMFSVHNKTNQLKGVELKDFYFSSETFFSTRYPIPIKSIRYNPFEGDKIFKPPFLAGLIKRSIFERINKSIFAAVITQNNIIQNEKIQHPIKNLSYMKTQLKLQICDFKISEISQFFDNLVSSADINYKKSFDSDINSLLKKATTEQEPSLFQDQISNGVFAYVDKQCVTARRWWIYGIFSSNEQDFETLLNQTIELIMINDPTTEEFYTYLRHFPSTDDPEKLVTNKLFQQSLKKHGFKWKQQNNDPDTGTRVITFQMKAPKSDKHIQSEEPLQLKSCQQLVQEPKIFIQHDAIATEEIILGYYCGYIDKIYISNQVQEKLAEVLKQTYFGAIRYKKLSGEKNIKDFLHTVEHNFIPPAFNHEIQIQLTNLCLRWQSFDVEVVDDIKTLCLKTEQSIFDESEQSIVQLKSSNPQFKKSLFLVNTLEEDIVFFLLEIEGTLPKNQVELEKILDKSFEAYDQKIHYEGSAIWVPIFTVTNTTTQFKGLDLKGATFNSQSFFTINYPSPIKSILNVQQEEDMVFKPPFIAGLIKRSLFEKINKSIFAAVITNNNIIKNQKPPEINKSLPNSKQHPKLYIKQFRIYDIVDYFQNLVDHSHETYLKSFDTDVDNLLKKATSEQETVLFQIEKYDSGGVFIYIDKQCVTARRWWIYGIFSPLENDFEALLSQTINLVLLNDPATDEFHISLRHFSSSEDPQKLIASKLFQQSLKQHGFKWKQQTNDAQSGTRVITYQMKPQKTDKYITSEEPIQLKSCLTLIDQNQQQKPIQQ